MKPGESVMTNGLLGTALYFSQGLTGALSWICFWCLVGWLINLWHKKKELTTQAEKEE